MSIIPVITSLGGKITLRKKFQPTTGTLKLLPSGVDGTTLAVLESSVIVDSTNVKIYFTKSVDGSHNAICMATAPTAGGTWTVNPTPIIGLGAGGAPANREANSSMVFKANGFYYCTATNGYGIGGSDDRNLYLYKSSDGVTWSDLGLLINKTAVAGSSGIGNSSIYPVLVNGKYEMLVEAFNSGIWRIYRFSSTSIESGWTFTNALPSLQIGGSSNTYGGMQHFYSGGKWYIFYHYGTAGNLPTLLSWAVSNDLVTATVKETPMFGLETLPYGSNTTQLADPFLVENNGITYLFAEYCENTPSFQSQIWMWTYSGTIVQLLANT